MSTVPSVRDHCGRGRTAKSPSVRGQDGPGAVFLRQDGDASVALTVAYPEIAEAFRDLNIPSCPGRAMPNLGQYFSGLRTPTCFCPKDLNIESTILLGLTGSTKLYSMVGIPNYLYSINSVKRVNTVGNTDQRWGAMLIG